MSFPTFKYKEIINEVWDGDEEDDQIRSSIQKILENRFFFVVFRCGDKCNKEEERTLENAFFWSMPSADLEEVRRVWSETVRRINSGEASKLPGAKWSSVAHVRPHAKNKLDTYETPEGRNLTKKCFWLNKEYIKKQIQNNQVKTTLSNQKIEKEQKVKLETKTVSPYLVDMISVQLYDSIGCGELMLADTVSDETIEVPSWLIKPGAKYFALRTRGDSMNGLGINDGDIILCQKNYQASSGSNAVVLIGDEATLKQIKYEKDGLLLIPKSTNPEHKIRKLTQDDEEFKVLGVFVAKI